MSIEYESNFCYGWDLPSDSALCETLKPFVNDVLHHYGLLPKGESYEASYSAEDAMYEVSEALYGVAEEVIDNNHALFPILRQIDDDIIIHWDNENTSFGIVVGRFHLSLEDMATIAVELIVLLDKIFEIHHVSLKTIERTPTCFHYVSSF